jgi:enamine deaminase RidA (YjgF/YER057c/UK114 family)
MSGSGPVFASPDDLASPPGYSHVVTIPAGRLVWTAGQIAMDSDGTVVGVGDWERQARQVFENLTRALDAAGADWSDVVKLTYFVVDVAGLAAIHAVRDEFVDRVGRRRARWCRWRGSPTRISCSRSRRSPRCRDGDPDRAPRASSDGRR